MDAERIRRALARIEEAAGRIEQAASVGGAPAGDPQLASRYDALRSETAAALQDLDRVIGSLEP